MYHVDPWRNPGDATHTEIMQAPILAEGFLPAEVKTNGLIVAVTAVRMSFENTSTRIGLAHIEFKRVAALSPEVPKVLCFSKF